MPSPPFTTVQALLFSPSLLSRRATHFAVQTLTPLFPKQLRASFFPKKVVPVPVINGSACENVF